MRPGGPTSWPPTATTSRPSGYTSPRWSAASSDAPSVPTPSRPTGERTRPWHWPAPCTTPEFSALPILADARQDAGCADEKALNPCRGDGCHGRGCWVVDLVLGKG